MSKQPIYPEKIQPGWYRIPRDPHPGMLVDGWVMASDALMAVLGADEAMQQVINVAHLPGIRGASLAMPDIHWGYGFPIGGVAATGGPDGVVSPGGIGYDINCGVRLLRTTLSAAEVRPFAGQLLAGFAAAIPTGKGRQADITMAGATADRVLTEGAAWAVSKDYGTAADLENCENRGALAGADPGALSPRALQRGRQQLGTLGGGNHFLELQEVAEVHDRTAAARLGLETGQCVIMIHTGSRGLGYQVCDDAVKEFARLPLTGTMPDRQLCCAPCSSIEGQRYIAAMAAAANFAWANRQVITDRTRTIFSRTLGKGPEQLGLELIWDVSHNIGQFEEHEIDGRRETVFVHRKGATRALPPGHPLLPEHYRDRGQPVIIPGDMGRASYLLLGQQPPMQLFFSCCHGAGRVQSRTKAARATSHRAVYDFLAERGVTVLATRDRAVLEEAPWAYKDIDAVIEVVTQLGIARPVARCKPFACLKG